MKCPRVNLEAALADAEIFVDGDWVESEDQDPDGDVRLIQLADVGDGAYVNKSARFLTSSKAVELRCTFLKPGDILVARMPDPLGRACIFPGDAQRAVTVVDVCIIRPNPDQQDARWLMHCLNAPQCRNQIAGFATGTTRSRISRGNLKKIEIPLLPLAKQQRIAEVLDRADALRAKRRASLAQLDTLTQAIFLDLFGDPATNPKGWAGRPIGEITSKFSDGPFGSNLKSEHYTETGVRVVRLQNIGVGEFVDDDAAYISERHFANLKKHECRPGDVLVGTLGAPNLRACIQPDWLPIALNKADCVQVRPNECIANATYICALLNQPATERMAQELMHGQTRVRISMGRLRGLKVPVPPIELQREFARQVQAVERLKTSHRASLAELDALFASLQHRAFRGEL